jgi:hypothetical protein
MNGFNYLCVVIVVIFGARMTGAAVRGADEEDEEEEGIIIASNTCSLLLPSLESSKHDLLSCCFSKRFIVFDFSSNLFDHQQRR